MAKLNAAKRKKLPASSFAIPASGKKDAAYPIHDKPHAVSALARVEANGTPGEKAKVRKAVKSAYPGLPSSKGKGGSAAAKAMKKSK